MVTLLDGHGFQVHLHTIGDRAVREALDAIETAQRANGRRHARHHLAHIQLVHPNDQTRLAELASSRTRSPTGPRTAATSTSSRFPTSARRGRATTIRSGAW